MIRIYKEFKIFYFQDGYALCQLKTETVDVKAFGSLQYILYSIANRINLRRNNGQNPKYHFKQISKTHGPFVQLYSKLIIVPGSKKKYTVQVSIANELLTAHSNDLVNLFEQLHILLRNKMREFKINT